MAIRNVVPPGAKPSRTPSAGGEATDTPRLIDHLAAWRPKTAQKFAAQIGGLFAFVRQNFFGAYLTTAALSVLALGLNLMALAGTIKIASLILFDWERAISFAAKLGIPVGGATKADVAWIGSGAILTFYMLAGIAAYLSKRSQAALLGHAERALYRRYLRHPSLTALLQSEDFRAAAPRAIAMYARCCLALALIPGLTMLSALIVIILAFFQPVLMAVVLLAILPLLLLYLLTGRRTRAADVILKGIEAKRRLLFRSLTASNRKAPALDTDASTRDEILELTGEFTKQRTKVRAIKGIPEAILSVVAGLVLATAMIVLTSTPTSSERLIYLLIGFIMIRFMFIYLKGAFGHIQAIVQDLDEIRFVNQTILSDTVGDTSELHLATGDEAPDDLDEVM